MNTEIPSHANALKAPVKITKEVLAFLLLTALGLFCIFNYVNMKPQVDNDFFFSSDDPQFHSEERISELFLRQDTLLIISARGDIESPYYYEKIRQLSDALSRLAGVSGVRSLSLGPSDLNDAENSPLWKRLLVSKDRSSTNLIMLVDDTQARHIILQIESIVEQFSSTDFKLNISGLPYVVELIRRNLLRDIRVFSALAFFIFGIVIYCVFRSKSIVFGSMIASLNACMLTFMITDLMKIPIGLLTANLATIVFVLTLTHMVFLTYNWIHICADKLPESRFVDEAIEYTFSASFWSMLTTLLGFLSLLFVPARPLRELGLSGSVGTVVAFIVAYGIYPAFLKMAAHSGYTSKTLEKQEERIYGFLESEKRSLRIILILFTLLAIPGLWKINSDPSLLSYFSKNSKIYKGLEYIDKNGGSSPLIIVIKASDGSKLVSQDAYRRMWKLQEALESHHGVGSAISLPVIMAEAKRNPIAFFLYWDWLLNILEKPEYDQIARAFVTKDRQYALFLFRMNELNRAQTRLEVINELEAIVRGQGFIPEITGGVYKLQGHMAKLIAQSLINGLNRLLILFFIIAFIISRSVRVALSITISICFLPVGILGTIGLYGIPLDVISSPASNVAIAMGIDSMIHMINTYRRKFNNKIDVLDRTQWTAVRDILWKPVLTSMIVVVTGFAIFLFSTFPPTQRFGLAIVFGTILASLTALYIMPLLARMKIGK